MSGTASWLNADDMVVLGWTIDGVWQGVIGDRPRVVALVARDPNGSARRLVYFDPAFRKLTTVPHPKDRMTKSIPAERLCPYCLTDIGEQHEDNPRGHACPGRESARRVLERDRHSYYHLSTHDRDRLDCALITLKRINLLMFEAEDEGKPPGTALRDEHGEVTLVEVARVVHVVADLESQFEGRRHPGNEGERDLVYKARRDAQSALGWLLETCK